MVIDLGGNFSPPNMRSPGTLAHVTLNRFVDNPDKKKVLAFLDELSKPLVLWAKNAYDHAGNYTQEQVNNRIKALIQKKSV